MRLPKLRGSRKKEVVMSSFASRLKAGTSTINKWASHEVGAQSVASLIRDTVKVFLPEDAKKISAAIDAAVAHHSKRKVGRSVAAPRGSELAGLLKMRQWNCWDDVFGVLIAEKASRYDCVNVSNWFRKHANVDKEKGTCPPRAAIVAAMVKGKTRKKKAKAKKPTPLQTLRADPKAVHAHMSMLASAFPSVIDDADAAPFVKALQSALKSLRPFVIEAADALKEK
jgi:Na+-transporting methylmalonyl-CoA/oxaloacetate decarboxylase gamma subunit